MRNSFSRHNQSIQTRVSDIWPNHHQATFRPLLNIQALHELLQITISNDTPDIVSLSGNGKKRAASAHSRQTRSSKRAKTSAWSATSRGGSGSATPNSTESGDFDWPLLNYPDLGYKPTPIQPSEDGQTVPVLQHIFELQYTNWPVSGHLDDADGFSGWKLEEENLKEMMTDLRASEARTIDLGEVEFTQYHGRLVVVSSMLKNRVPWSLLLPLLDCGDGIDLAWCDILSDTVEDPMMAAYILKSVGRTAIQARLKIVISPFSTCDMSQHELPFQLQVEANVSLRFPNISEPFPRPDKKKKSSEVEDAQRRLLEYLYPSNAITPESFDGSTNISFFYSILRPAPPLPSALMQEAMQPLELLPTLLPFQRRSVAWLLDREGKTVSPNGEVVPKPISTDFSFWERVEEGNSTFYLNRLSGLLSPTLPESPPILGGILAEEPGLGKTLESIALILMNPAPPERNPTMTRWDPEAQLEVKAIKSTLIVTPPALASQWVDELAAHAPSLKVMVYDGWSKVPVPVTQSQVEAAKLELLKKKLKGLKKPKSKWKAKMIDEENDHNYDMVDVDDDDSACASASADSGEVGMIQDWCSYVNTFDVVITTYSVLRMDFNVALAAPVRPRREDVVYSNVERTRSPLVMVEWNRVIMDEVQMVGGGKVEDMVSLIPRLSSFAVSGTPARQQVADLTHVLKFLRVDDIIGSTRLWNRLISTGFGAAHFAALFQAYGIRTLKANVKEELTIPQQTRYLVNITLGPVEKHVYDQALEAALQDLGLDARGIAASERWQLDGTVLRSALGRLRGICTHPQVGQLQRPGDKLFKPGAVKTIDDVLQNMRETNWRTMMDDRKAKVQTLIRIAQLQARDEDDLERFQHALNTLIDAEMEANGLIDEAQVALDKYQAKKRQSKKEALELSEKGKGKQRQLSEELEGLLDDDDNDSEGDEGDSPRGEAHSKKRGALQNRLRECRIALHRAKFLQGDMHHALGPDQSTAEDAAYGAAENIRRELLKGTEDDATRAMELLTSDALRKDIAKDPLMIEELFLDDSKLIPILEAYYPTKAELAAKPKPYKVTMFERISASVDLINEANTIIEDVLNCQSTLLWEWRTHVTSLLTQKLASSEDQPDGDEYQRTLDNQGEAETYLQSYAALLADRRQALLNERTLLAAHDIREKKLRHTKAAMNAANAVKETLAELQVPEDVELQPEHEVLHLQLSKKRKALLELLEGRAVKSVLVALNAAAMRITKDSDPEKLALKEAVARLRHLIADQGPLMDKLEADLVLIRKAFNQRILYFRQLQEISDTVAEVVWDGTVVEALLEATLETNELDAEINTSRARQRYLETLTQKKEDGITDEDEESCILCRCDFVRGFITHCAHECMKTWLLRKEGKTCPVCRVSIDPDTIERFEVTANELEGEKPAQRVVNGEHVLKSRRQITYNMIDPRLFDEVNSMESFGDYGSKIQTLVRHLLYLQNTDPGAKSIVFSAWADSLLIMERALKSNGIRCLRIDQKSKGESAAKRFKSDPEILVLLLHGERENAGLNVTCASRVFLLESVVHHGFEIQAIARIDRMGQTRPTEVYCYYAEDTVERNILDLAARQGLSLYTTENSAGTLNVSSFSPEEADTSRAVVDVPRKTQKKKGAQKGDFIFRMDDMLAILFPHMYEELEYLIPLGVEEDAEMEEAQPLSSSPPSAGGHQGAVAGPSRLS
ncbi:hypothetical protein D9615_007143 [Tricholomella constricta]|uniref:Helicase ATP-binding domain-containing protein n=1 Tax=Tricholomella constricta TaxID=117010 RepID=A0A8H5M2M0_9AGAR|nr:hypothetical protein D9615_007143 [Tricholomella constricta]